MTHSFFAHRCLEFAAKARGLTGTNPMVGSVLVRDGKSIAEGFHSGFGKPHAELEVIQKIEQEIRSEDILYVNLEPCFHTDKKTPPCAQLIVEKGIKHVVFGMIDPNPKVAGKGIAFLRSKGVECTGPILLADSLRLNRGFVSLMTAGRPWITLKNARTSDGAIANEDGSPRRITTEVQDQWSHQFLRARHDAILVGAGTILADDPTLTVRHGDLRPDIWRIVLDPHGKIPLTAKIVNGELARKTIVIREGTEGTKGTDGTEEMLKQRGVRIVRIPLSGSSFHWTTLFEALTTSDGDFYGISSILVEGGKRTWEIFKNAGVVDEEVVLIGK